MMFSLLESNHLLEKDEFNRIQRKLGIIIRNSSDVQRLLYSLHQSLHRLGSPWGVISRRGKNATALFLRLLQSFGTLPVKDLTTSEQSILAEHPYVVAVRDGYYFVYREAYDLLMRDSEIRKRGFLFSDLHYLSATEKKAYIRWLKSEKAIPGRTITLYAEIAHYRMERLPPRKDFPAAGIENTYLDELFSIDPLVSPVGWFFRGVIPFYRALHDYESHTVTKPDEKIMKQISLFKYGYYTIHATEQGFGKPVRWEIKPTLEDYRFYAGSTPPSTREGLFSRRESSLLL